MRVEGILGIVGFLFVWLIIRLKLLKLKIKDDIHFV